MVVIRAEEDGTLWLDFGDGAVQSRMLRADPSRLMLEYTRLMMGFSSSSRHPSGLR